MDIKAIIIDLDGTIVDFNLDYKASRAEIIQHLVEEGFPQSIFSINDNLLDILNKTEIFLKNHQRENDVEKMKKSIFFIAEKHEMEAAHTTNIIPGIREALKALREMKLKLALFTVSCKNSVNYVLRVFDLNRYFDAIITRDDVLMIKPTPAHLEMALDAVGVKPREAIVVGGSVWDMKSARALKVFAVGATTGVASSHELTDAGAHHIVSSPTAMILLVEQLMQRGTGK